MWRKNQKQVLLMKPSKRAKIRSPWHICRDSSSKILTTRSSWRIKSPIRRSWVPRNALCRITLNDTANLSLSFVENNSQYIIPNLKKSPSSKVDMLSMVPGKYKQYKRKFIPELPPRAKKDRGYRLPKDVTMGRNLASVSSIQKIDTHEVFGLDKDASQIMETEAINEQ